MCSIFKLSSMLKAQTKHGFYLKDKYLAATGRSQVFPITHECYTHVVKHATVPVSQPSRPGEPSACAGPKEQISLHSEHEQQYVLTQPRFSPPAEARQQATASRDGNEWKCLMYSLTKNHREFLTVISNFSPFKDLITLQVVLIFVLTYNFSLQFTGFMQKNVTEVLQR